MKTIIVVSDTHGNRRAIEELFPVMGECDYIIHLGDTSQDGAYIRAAFPQKTYVVNGNCDLMKAGENELTLTVEGVKIFACHGHMYSVKYTQAKLIERAKALGCGVALYGHTHSAFEGEVDGVLVVNPGTLSRYSKKSYCYLVINGAKAVAKIVDADERNL